MPEGVAKDGKEDAKAKSKESSPRRKPTGNTARAKIELLDGSTMDLDVDRKIRGHELLSKVCDNLNLVEKDYFGLLYEDRGDPRVWIDLEKRVSKMLKHEPWMVRFAVKFYPPEPAQLQEELTRYQLVLAVRKDLLEGRLPCSSVTHALLASYLLQSELGDFEESEVGAGMCKQLKLVPPSSCTPELEEKVVELHRTHRGQTPAEAELNYLENAKKLAMYGVDLHPAKDSENVDITLGVCSSGLLVHREKLRINRFAWPKILKISYKRHNFYVKLRPGEFEQFESTVGFKLANHRAAKKLWKTCVEHHTFFRLMSPEPAAKSSLFPRLGSRFRYSGRTHYESRAALPQRTPPHFARTLSNRKLSSRSMDALAAGDKDESMPPEAVKRHTMPPQPAPRPTVKDKLRRQSGGTASASSASSLEGEYLTDRAEKKPPAGAVRVMPTGTPDKKDDKRSGDQRKPAENGTDTASDPGLTNNVDTTPKKSKGGFGLFGPRNKSPKPEKSPKRDKSPKEDKSQKGKDQKDKDAKVKVPVLDTSYDSSNLDSSVEKSPAKEGKPSFTKPYEYTDTERSPTRAKPFIQGGFSYDKEPISDEKQRALDESQSPTTRKAGLAFNYAPGEDKKVAESAEKRKTPEDLSKLKTPGIDYVQSAALKEQAKNLIDPTLALLDAERAHHEVPTPLPIVAPKQANEIQVVIITGKYNPKSKKLDDANGIILVTKGTLNKANGKIQTDKELINTKSGQVSYTDPTTGKQEVKNGHVDSKFGHILFTSGVIDPKTGKLDPTLAQQYCFVEKLSDKVGTKPGREVDLVVITGKYDGKHKKLDASHGHVELSRAVVGPDGIVSSNYGTIDPRTGKIDYIDPKTAKQEPKQAYVDQKTGNILVTTGVVDPKSGKVDTSLGQQFSIVEKDATKANREVRLVIVTSKYDLKNKKLDPTFVHVDSVKGVLSGADGKIYTEYGIIDPRTGEIQVTDSKTGKQEIKQAQIDPKTGNILLLSGVIDPRTGQLDTSLGQQYSIVDRPIDTFAAVPGKEVQVVAITGKYDPKSKKLDNPNGFVETSHGVISDKDAKVHTNFGILDPDTGKIHFTDPKTGKKDFKQANIDPKTGSFILTSGVIDPKTGKTDSSLAQQLTVVDKDAPKGILERYASLVIVTSKYDPKNKKLDTINAHIDNLPGKYGSDDKVYTDYGVVDPATGEITFTDPSTGKKEVKKAAVDPKTGNLLLTTGVVDPLTGQVDSTLGQQISVVDKPKDRFASVPGKEVQLVVITSKYDPKYKRLDNPNGYVETSRGIVTKDGRIQSNFGFIDPKTGKIEHVDPKTGKQEIKQAVADPKTGHLIISSGVVDPKTGKVDSSLAQQIVIVDKDSKVIPDKYVNLVFVTSKYDLKNKKLDLSDAHVDMVPGKITPDNKVLTEFGVVDPNNGEIIITNSATGRQEVKKALVDPNSGNLLLTSSVIDPLSGEVDPTLGQQISVVEKPKDTFSSVPGKEVELVVITSKYDPRTKKLDNPNGFIETSRGVIAVDGRVHTNFGVIDPRTGKIEYVDPNTGKHELKQALVDPKTGHLTIISGVVDPKTGKIDPALGQQLVVVDKDAPKRKYVNLVIVTSKYDLKNKKLDLANAHVDTLSGKTGADGKVHTENIDLDPLTGEITILDSSTGKRDSKKAIVDPKTGNLVLTSGVVDPQTGLVDTSLAQQISVVERPKDSFKPVTGKEIQVVIVTNKFDTKNKKLDNPNGHIDVSRGIIAADGRVHSNYGIIDQTTGKIEHVDPKTGKHELKQAFVDPKTGYITVTSGVVDPKTGRVDPTLGQQLMLVDKDAPKEKYVNLVIVTSKYDLKNKKLDLTNAHIDSVPGKVGADGKVHTEFGDLDPVTGEIIFVDTITGRRDIKKAIVDPKTGNICLTSGVVDPHTGLVDPSLAQQISVVERPKDVFNPVPGKEVQLVIITSKYDTKNKKLDNPNGHIETSRGIVAADGRVHTNYGIIDPKTAKIEYIDPKTGKREMKQAVAEPVVGFNSSNIILSSGVVDPKTGKLDSSLAQQFTIVEKDTKPKEREIHLVIITTKYDPRTKKIDPSQGHVDTVSGSIGPDGKIRTAVGVIDPVTGEIIVTDPTTGRQEVKRAAVNPTTGHMVVSSNVVDPKTGKVDPNLVQQFSIVNKPVVSHPKPVSKGEVRLVIVTSKYDPYTKSVDAGVGTVDAAKGYVSEDGKIHTAFGIIDPRSGQILYKDPITGKQELKQADIDPKTGNLIVTTAVVDPRTGKVEPSYAQQLTIVDKQHVLSPAPQRVSVSPARQIPTPVKTPIPPPLQSPVRTSSPIISSYAQKSSPITPTTPKSPVKPMMAPPEPPKRKIVKIMVIFTRIDPKTKKPDMNTAEVEHLTGILDPNGLIETKYGVIDSRKGTILITDASGQKQNKEGIVLTETGQIFINSGAFDPKTGKIDSNLGMILSVAKQDDPVVEITAITGPIDPSTGKVNIEKGVVEHTKGKVDADTGHISTKYGVIDPSNGVIFVTDTSDAKHVEIEKNNGQITVRGVVDPKTGKSDPKLGQVIVVGTHIDPVVEVTTFVGKLDSKKGIIEPKHSLVESTTGQLNPENNKIDTKYGQIDLVKGTVTYNDPKTGRFESQDLKVDPITGQFLLRSGQVNPKSGKPDKDIGRLICLRIIQNKIDPVSGKQIVSNDPKNVKVDPKTNQIWVAGPKDPQTGETLYTAGQIDPVTGYIITIYGRLDPKTGYIVRTTDIDKSLIKVDPVNGQIYTATGEVDENNQPLYSASQVDPGTGEIYTKLGRIDARTGRLIIIKIYVITQKDEKGRVKEVDPKECTIDETTGRIITTKTVYLYQIIDPITGETIDVDPDDPRLKGARTTVTQTMTLSGKIDPVTGRIKTEYGDIDPDTGDIDPSTAVRDPVTGQLILHYSQIDPSHFEDKSGNYTIEKETQDLPANIDIQTVNTHKFSTFGKDESPLRGDEPKTFTEYTTSEHIRHQGFVSSTTPLSSKIPISQRAKKTPTPPVVVKTTTKQLLTKNDEGVTHNVEHEIENLGTGEVTFSTHTNKAESVEPMEGKSPYVTARAVTTRTATTHHDLDTKAKTQQMEEKTVAHTLTSSATRQEQRVLTQEVKTMVTTGDQLGRRGSTSSLSSGDSGTPIDFEEAAEGHYYVTEPGSYSTTTTSTVMGNAPFGSMVYGATARTSTGAPASAAEPVLGADETEVVSSQTISSKTRTVETITYKTERNGVIETRVEQKITIQSDGDPIDHDRALAEAIQEATAMNPDMTVEKIEIQQQSTQP